MSLTWRNYWHPIATSDEVTTQPRQFVLLDEPLVAFRDGAGVIVFKDLCIHRGTALSLGSITAEGNLRCGYHGWEYDRTGACVLTPSRPPDAPIPRAARATAYRAEDAVGLVWVALDTPAAPIPSAPNDEWNDPSFLTQVSPPATWHASAGRVVENFLDFTHFPFVHKGLLGNETLAPHHEIVETDYGLRYSIVQSEAGPIDNRVEVRRDYHLYFPFTAHVTTVAGAERRVVSLAVSPTRAKQARLFFVMSRNYGLDEAIQQELDEYATTLREQDREIVESQRPEEIPLDLRVELHLKGPDAAGLAYRRMLSKIEPVA